VGGAGALRVLTSPRESQVLAFVCRSVDDLLNPDMVRDSDLREFCGMSEEEVESFRAAVEYAEKKRNVGALYKDVLHDVADDIVSLEERRRVLKRETLNCLREVRQQRRHTDIKRACTITSCPWCVSLHE